MNIGKTVTKVFTTMLAAGMLFVSPIKSALAQHTNGATSVYNHIQRTHTFDQEYTVLYAGPDSADMMIEHVVPDYGNDNHIDKKTTTTLRAEDFDDDGKADLVVISIENYVAGQGRTTETARFYRGPEFINYELGLIGQFRNGCYLEDKKTKVWVTEDEKGHNVYAVDMVEQRDLYNLQAVSKSGVSISGFEAMIKRLIADEKDNLQYSS